MNLLKPAAIKIFTTEILMGTPEVKSNQKATFLIHEFLDTVQLDDDEFEKFVQVICSVVKSTALYTMVKDERVKMENRAGIRE